MSLIGVRFMRLRGVASMVESHGRTAFQSTMTGVCSGLNDAGSFRARTISQAFAAIGFDSDKGVGKAVAVTYGGEPEGLKEYAATEFDYHGQDYPSAAQIGDAQARLDGVTAGSIPTETPYDHAFAKAEAERDNATTMVLKGQQVDSWFRP